MRNRVLELFDRMRSIEAEHQDELDVISERYKVDEITWIGLSSVWTILLTLLNADETQTVVDLLSLGLEKFNAQPLSIRVGFITLPKQLCESLKNERKAPSHQDGPSGNHANEGE